MLSKTVSLYKSAYRGLSHSTWLLSFIMLVNRSGTMVLPFMTIYLTSPSMGYSIGDAGIVMGLFGLGSVVGGFIGGKFTDKIGFYPVQLFTLTGGGILFIVLGQMKSFPLICLFSFLLSMINEAFRPANSTAVAYYSNPENQTRSYSLNRLAVNLGWAVGGGLGGILASINYQLLFWVDGFTNIAAALLMWYYLPPSTNYIRPEKRTEVTEKLHSAYKDRIYLSFIALTVLFATCFFQVFTTLTVYYKIELHFSESFIGFVMALNGLVIALVEMVMIYQLERKRRNTFYIMTGVFLCGLAYLMLNIFYINPLMAILMMLLITFGEMFALPFMNSFWISRSDRYNRGQYAGLYTIAWSIAQTFGPMFGSQVAEHNGFSLLWWSVAGLCFITSIGFWILNKSNG